ncbi:LysR substrate-binding domain-containing protein [Rhodobacteraceae bacterium KMM 6894]|nr:LysR substrate-binding domain-containing protein [Rhodobacteraceae bacterium KMM 6894]
MSDLPNLTIRQLQTFAAVMRSGSITEASRVLGRTQPAVSAMIMSVERELGLRLFVRDRRRLTPCPEAYYFLEEAEDVLERLGRAANMMSELKSLDRGRLRIACMPAACNVFMPGLLGTFLKDKPGVKADLMMRSSVVIEDLIASQEYDIGLAETPAPRPSILIEPFQLRNVVAVPASSPLAALDRISPKDLAGFPMATLFDTHKSWLDLKKTFDRCNVPLNRQFILRTVEPALIFVRQGLCASVVDTITAASHPWPEVVYRPLTETLITEISLLKPKHRPASALADAFYNVVSDSIRRFQHL